MSIFSSISKKIGGVRYGQEKFRKRMQSMLMSSCDHQISIFYKKRFNSLSELCDKHGSDKGENRTDNHPYGWSSHSYADIYSMIFGHCRDHIKTLFECGIGTNNTTYSANMTADGKPGASLRVWRDYFPQAQIYGADIDKDVLFEEDRIKTFYIDQTNPDDIAKFWNLIPEQHIDCIIDDGYHVYEAGICLFENSIHKLSEKGIYIIEDVMMSDMKKYRDFFVNKSYDVNFIALAKDAIHSKNNNMVIIRKSL